MEEIHQRYKDRVAFLAVYVREAHPTDGWRMSSNDRAGIAVAQPRTAADRFAVAKHCCDALEITMPVVVDELDDRVGHAYSGMPDRLYLLDADGRVVYKSGRGPFGFRVGELDQAITLHLLDEGATATQQQGRVPVLTDEAAWKKLPPAEKGAGQPLPAWARTFAATLPRTTAAMLELDYLQRAKSPLDPKLRGMMRWAAAHANRCTYSEAYALADLRGAGADEAMLKALTGDQSRLPEATRLALEFARKLTLAADTVTDEEMAALEQLYGDKQLVAMVLLLAYASFQDRLLLTLGLDVEPAGPLPPLDVRFSKETAPPAAPRNTPDPQPSTIAALVKDPEWTRHSFAQLQQNMEQQRRRQGRIRVPSWDEVKAGLPAGYPANRTLRIRWSLVCLGYQPELAGAWFACLRTFADESRQDRVFEESLFWVITRSLDCFY